jgi:hypothetical protein
MSIRQDALLVDGSLSPERIMVWNKMSWQRIQFNGNDRERSIKHLRRLCQITRYQQ